MSKYRRKNKIAGQFSARTVEMLESPAYQVLSLHAHRILARLEIEHAHHGGNDNGRLPCTYDHFEEYGVRRHAIKSTLRELEGLGFIEITEKGRAGNAEFKSQAHGAITRLQVRDQDVFSRREVCARPHSYHVREKRLQFDIAKVSGPETGPL